MIVDAYKECPCGSGKKVKFCCSADIVNELDKVVRAMLGDQRRSALDQVERLDRSGSSNFRMGTNSCFLILSRPNLK